MGFLTLEHLSVLSLGGRGAGLQPNHEALQTHTHSCMASSRSTSEENLPDAALCFPGFLQCVQRIPGVEAVRRMAGPLFRRRYWFLLRTFLSWHDYRLTSNCKGSQEKSHIPFAGFLPVVISDIFINTVSTRGVWRWRSACRALCRYTTHASHGTTTVISYRTIPSPQTSPSLRSFMDVPPFSTSGNH